MVYCFHWDESDEFGATIANVFNWLTLSLQLVLSFAIFTKLQPAAVLRQAQRRRRRREIYHKMNWIRFHWSRFKRFCYATILKHCHTGIFLVDAGQPNGSFFSSELWCPLLVQPKEVVFISSFFWKVPWLWIGVHRSPKFISFVTTIFLLYYLTKNCPAEKSKKHGNMPWKFHGWGG